MKLAIEASTAAALIAADHNEPTLRILLSYSTLIV